MGAVLAVEMRKHHEAADAFETAGVRHPHMAN
jgi:hypothetical protein